MKTKQVFFNMVLLTAFLVGACNGTPAPTADAMMNKEVPTSDAMMSKETPTADAMMTNETPAADTMMSKEAPTPDLMMGKETPTADAMMSKETPAADSMMESPSWYSASFTDASTERAFTIQDFKGKVILVESMAIWCPTCLKQQEQVKALHGLLGQRDDFVSIGLDIDPNEDSAHLKSYVEDNGFDWLHVISPADVSHELSSLYGAQFLNPPSTPIVVIDRHGVAHPTPFGLKSADDLMKFIQPFLDEAM
jgi:cytochrome oxidase Cu insertion factor (SCO1/SenC/PrrC family)